MSYALRQRTRHNTESGVEHFSDRQDSNVIAARASTSGGFLCRCVFAAHEGSPRDIVGSRVECSWRKTSCLCIPASARRNPSIKVFVWTDRLATVAHRHKTSPSNHSIAAVGRRLRLVSFVSLKQHSSMDPSASISIVCNSCSCCHSKTIPPSPLGTARLGGRIS